MKIGVITYDIPHKKTQDILVRLIDKDITVITTPFHERKQQKKLYSHRPNMYSDVSTIKLCETLGFNYRKYSSKIINDMNVVLIGGCGIIETSDTKIINSHPGYLPYCRGLDALKWAIYNGNPIGVTTHVINNEVDAGYLIEQEFITVNFYDTFHSVAMRQYNKEIDLIVKSINKPVCEKIDIKNHIVNKRMPIELEPIMFERFETLRKKSKL